MDTAPCWVSTRRSRTPETLGTCLRIPLVRSLKLRTRSFHWTKASWTEVNPHRLASPSCLGCGAQHQPSRLGRGCTAPTLHHFRQPDKCYRASFRKAFPSAPIPLHLSARLLLPHHTLNASIPSCIAPSSSKFGSSDKCVLFCSSDILSSSPLT